MNRYEEALAAFEEALRLDPTLTKTLYEKGVALVRLERYEKAIAAFEETLDLDPTFDAATQARKQAIRLARRPGSLLLFLARFWFKGKA